MFDTYLIHQQPDPRLRKRMAFATSLAIATTLMSGAFLWVTEKMQISMVSPPGSDFLIFALEELTAPPPPPPPAAPAGAVEDPPEEVEDEDPDILEDPEQPPDEVPTEIPKTKRSKSDVLKSIGNSQGTGMGIGLGIGTGTGTCVVGCGQVKVKTPTTTTTKPPPEVDFSALTCRVCPDPPQKELARSQAAMMGRPSVSNKTRFCVDASGKVESVSVRRKSGDADVDRIIKQTVRKWRFAPMKVDGRARKACSTAAFDIKFE